MSRARLIADLGWRGLKEFDPFVFIHPGQHDFIRDNDVASQDAAQVTAGLRAMHDVMLDRIVAAKAAGISIKVSAVYNGAFAVNDEIFSEDFAETIWNIGHTLDSRMLFDFSNATLHCKGFASHKAARTSGLWADLGITDPLPKALIRVEVPSTYKRPYVSLIGGTIIGENATTDPIGIKLMHPNFLNLEKFAAHNLRNTARFLEGVNNSNIETDAVACGWQPTEAGGNGFLPSTARFSCTAGGSDTVITATEAVFIDPDHVGKWFALQGAGPNGAAFYAEIASVDSTTQITVNRVASINVSSKKGSFLQIRGAISADSDQLVLSMPVSTDMVGRYVAVWKAGTKLITQQDLLVTRVIAQAGDNKTLTLASQARWTATGTPVAFAPALFTGRSDDFKVSAGTLSPGNNNDTQFWGDRGEFSFTDTWGSAILFIGQALVRSQGFGQKWHGTDQAYNNFGAGAALEWLDHCQQWQVNTPQYEWSDGLPGYGRLMHCGEQMQVDRIAPGFGTTEGSHAAFLYIDPQTANNGRSWRIVHFGGKIDQFDTYWAQADQAYYRFGPNGRDIHFCTVGPVGVRPVMAPGTFDKPRDRRFVKSADQTVNNSTTYVDVADLIIPVTVDEVLTIDWDLFVNTNSTANIKVKVVTPGGTSGKTSFRGPRQLVGGTIGGSGAFGIGVDMTIGGLGAEQAVSFVSELTIGASGEVKIQFAQNTADASDTKILAKSVARVKRG